MLSHRNVLFKYTLYTVYNKFTLTKNISSYNYSHSLEPIKPRITETGRDLKIETITRLTEAVGGNILCRDGIDLELTCTAQGIPTPEIVWLRGNKTVGTGFKLSLGILREDSSGDYTCLATNVGGEDKKTTKLNVKCTYNMQV